MSYHSDFNTEPIGRGNPYSRCIHCHRSVPEINGRIEGHTKGCFYRNCKEANFDYNLAWQREQYPQQDPDWSDGPREEGFFGPRPWNNFDDTEEKQQDAIDVIGRLISPQ